MKKTALIFVLFSLYMNAQTSFPTYDHLWKEVEKLEMENLPKSANEKVGTIYELAQKDQNHPQLIKALLFQSKFAIILEEDAQLTIIHRLEKEISETDFPTRNILESILANLYWQYFQQNRWQFYHRTETAEKVDPADFRTWDLMTLFKEVQTHFDRSLENAQLLQQTDTKYFDTILTEGKDDAVYRPTMYDFLVYQALDFYQTDEINLTQPTYKFELDNPNVMASVEEFVKLSLETRDTLSLQFKALQLYQNLLKFHLKDAQPDALILADTERLNFVKTHAVFPDAESVLAETLQISQKLYQAYASGTWYDALLAELYSNQGFSYQYPHQITHKWKLKEALEICHQAITRFPESIGSKKCESLKHNILQPSINLISEEYIPENQPALLSISFKNISQLYFKILKTNFEQTREFLKTYDDQKLLKQFKNLKTVKNWTQTLPFEGDYQQHSIETTIPVLPQGAYVVLASSDPDFNTKFAYTFVQATDLALTEWHSGTEQRLQLVNRNTGKPISKATVRVKNKPNNRYDKPFDKTYTTNPNGFIFLPKDNYYNNLTATVKSGSKNAVFGTYYINQSYRNNPNYKDYYQAFLFTDRSIYRPGQTVYFKGIVLERHPDKTITTSQVVANEKITVFLKDVNWQDVARLELTTNQFGSVTGTFTLPDSGLTGAYHLLLNGNKDLINGSTDISVEEYKRPKFETAFNPVKEIFKVNDSVTITGVATAYAGSPITDAKVVYRVHRKVQYPRWCYWRMPNFYAEPQEITHGETTTNEKGEFNITFTALPDKSVEVENLPVFHYEITADVTDLNGETRSGNTVVNVGYHSLLVNLQTENKWETTDGQQKITIQTQNLNGEKIPAKGILKIYKLQNPDRVLRKRPWNAPDLQNWDEQAFKTLFPHIPYRDEENVNSRPLGKMVYSKEFETTESQDAEVLLKKEFTGWNSGTYQIIAESTDKNGKTVTDKSVLEIHNPKEKKVTDNQLITVTTDKFLYQPGEKVVLKIGSASPDVTVMVSVEKDYKITQTHRLELSDQIKVLEIPVTEKDLGGFAIQYSLVNFNQFQFGNLPIDVTLKDEPLTLETATFTDKMQPGSEQTWRFTLKGLQKDQKTAEILAAMYDASLDQFRPHQWQKPDLPLYNNYWSTVSVQANNSFRNAHYRVYNFYEPFDTTYQDLQFKDLNWFGFSFGNGRMMIRGMYSLSDKSAQKRNKGEIMGVTEMDIAEEKVEEVVMAEPIADDQDSDGNNAATGSEQNETREEPQTDFTDVKVRTNFNETAFFYPQLTTDPEGNVSFSFTSPEALTRWKLQLLGHTTNMKTAYLSANTVTQKDLMVLPNPPRFLREGDQISFSTKISNLSDKPLNGTALLELIDPVTGKNIDAKLTDGNLQQDFKVDAKGNTSVSWTLHIPFDVQAVQYKIMAKADGFSDGEQNALPVLSNRMLVTETMPIWINSKETKVFTLDKLQKNTSTTLQNHKLTLELTSNPVWYAVQSLPYLMEYPYECSEQTFSRYYANALATKIVNDNPKIKAVFDAWENSDALLSNLEKNEELKSLLIAETPWLRDAQSETEQKKRIALLFDLKKMTKELEKNAQKLRDMQFPDGGFPWFKGARYPDRYITQYIAAGFGHLEKLGVFPLPTKALFKTNENEKTHQMLVKAVNFLDNEIVKDYQELLKQADIIREKAKIKTEGEKKAKEFMEANHLGALQLHYLYTRTFYPEVPLNDTTSTAVTYFTKQAYQYWKEYSLYQKGLIALVAKRNQKPDIAERIVKSLDENSITNEELGMYWKENKASWWWHQAPIETQALMIETFAEVKPVQKQLDLLKVWLLKNKQTNRWETTKSTTEAIYALLAYGTDWTQNEDLIVAKVGNKTVTPQKEDIEAGTGYFKTNWQADEITPDKAVVTLTNQNNGIAWGGLYWQYFENLDKITFAVTPLAISKKLFLKKNEDTGEKLYEITPTSTLKVGDLVRVRIEIKVDRDMEYVHLKDMRASGFEPVNVLSQYRYQDGLGYYESTKDAATNFFFNYLPKGVYVFEYDLRANNAGDFSNGITTMQCMYAPEFTSHSEGVRVKITNDK